MKNKLPKDKILKPGLPPSGSVKVIGLGGVGSIVARYGAVFLASMGKSCRMVLVDGDQFEPSNASRMIFGNFGNKASVIRKELLARFMDSKLAIMAVEEYITPENIGGLIKSGDTIILCVDNHATRKLVSDHCCKLKDVCLISGGNDGVGKDSSGEVRRGTYGNVQIHVRRKGRDLTHPLTQFHTEIANPADKMPGDINCTEMVVSKPQILFANLAVASAMLNTLLLQLSSSTHYSEIGFDIADGWMRPTIHVL